MELTPQSLKLDLDDIEKRIERFIKIYVKNAGTSGVVLGLSGGIDSNTVAALCAKAIGGNRVLGLILPEAETKSDKDIEDENILQTNLV